MVTSNDINFVNSDLNNLIDEVVSSNPQLNNKIQKVKEESNLFICEILKFYTVKDNVQVRILSNNQVVTAHCTHDILSKDVSLKSMVKGVVNSDKNGATYIVPHSTIYGILAKVRYSGVTDEYCLISCVNFEDDFDLKSNVDSGEIRLTVGNSRLSVNDERINIMCPELFINGLPFSAPEFDNYHTVDDVNEIYNTLDESIKSVIVFGYYKDNNFYTTESYDEVIEKNNTKLFIDLATDTLYCVINDNYISVGGGSSSNDYAVLVNKPCIDGVELNKESSSTGLGLATKYEVSNKQDKLIAGENISINDNVISASRGVTDYDTLTSKPSINNITLTGDKSSDDLGLASKEHNHIIDDVEGLLNILDSKADDSELSNYLNKEDIIDTGWLDLPLTNNFSIYNDFTPKYRQIGGLVFIRGIVTPKSSISFNNTSTKVKIANLPLNIQPNYEIFNLQTISATYKYRLEISSQGLFISNPSSGSSLVSSISSSAYLSITCCYCLEDVLIGMINDIISGAGDYNTLDNKPSINGNTLIGDTVLDIPSDLSDLNEDDDHKVVTSNQIDYWNNKLETNELNNYTKTVDLDNLIATYGYLKTHQSLENYYTKSETNNVVSNATNDMATQTWVSEQGYLTSVPVLTVNGKIGNVVLTPSDLGLGSVFKIKGSKPTKNDLPITNNEIGDVWYVINESVGYIWLNDGTTNRWEQLGLEVDLSNYATITQLNTSLLNYVEKITGKELSSNDFTDSLKNKLEGLSNYDDTEIRNLLNNKADTVHNHNINDVTNLSNSLNNKVDKVSGKGLSTVDFTDTNYVHTDNNYTSNEKNKLASLENYDDTDVWVTLQELETNKQDTLVSGSNIKTINDQSLLGSGNITIQGGGGGTSNYNDLTNKPLINNVVLTGDKSSDDLGLANAEHNHNELYYDKSEVDSIINNHHDSTKVDKVNGKGLSTNDYTTTEKQKLASLENYDDTTLTNAIQLINNKISENASATNKLTDTNFVNSSIATNTAYFRGTFESKQSLDNYSGDKTINDYAFVVIYDSVVTTEVKQYDRYKWNGSAWIFEYTLNNSSFTSEQWATINSGLDSNSLSDYYNKSSIDSKLESKSDKSNTYSKGDVDSLLTGKMNSSSSDLSTASGTYYNAYKQFNIVSVYMNRNNYSPTKNTWVTLGNLPDGFRPVQDMYMEYQDFRIRIQSGGAIQVYTANTPITILFNMTYIVV